MLGSVDATSGWVAAAATVVDVVLAGARAVDDVDVVTAGATVVDVVLAGARVVDDVDDVDVVKAAATVVDVVLAAGVLAKRDALIASQSSPPVNQRPSRPFSPRGSI